MIALLLPLLLILSETGAPGSRAFLGIEFGATPGGLRVARVVHAGPADDAGVREGDLVRSVGGVAVDTFDAVVERLATATPGAVLEIVVLRDGADVPISVTLGERRLHVTGPERIEHVLSVLRVGPGDRVADIGCGDGWLTSPVARAVQPGGLAYAVELRPTMVERIRERDEEGVIAVHSRPDDVSLPASSIDVAFLHDVASHVADTDKPGFFASIDRALTPEGRLVVFGPHGEARWLLTNIERFGFVADDRDALFALEDGLLDERLLEGITLRRLARWPQWRGPLGTGEAPHADPPVRWSESENVRFKVALPGKGHSTPVVWGDRLFVTTAVPYGPKFAPAPFNVPPEHDNAPVTQRQRFQVIAIDRHDGRTLWTTTVREATPRAAGHVTGSLASSSPVTDGSVVVASFGSHGLYGLDLDGGLLWERDLGAMRPKHEHGEGASPALHAGVVVVPMDHEGESSIVALDAETGETRWRSARDEVTSWSSPLIVLVAGRAQAIVNGTHRVRAYDLKTGDVIWECGGLSNNVCATPVAAAGFVVVGSSYEKRAMFAIRLEGASGDVTGTDQVAWFRSRGTPYVPSPLLYGDAVYFLAHYQGVLSRVDLATGAEPAGPVRLDGMYDIYASPLGAAGRLYVVDRDGTTAVLTHAPEPAPLATNRLDDVFSASPVAVGRTLYLRGDHSLYALEEDPEPADED